MLHPPLIKPLTVKSVFTENALKKKNLLENERRLLGFGTNLSRGPSYVQRPDLSVSPSAPALNTMLRIENILNKSPSQQITPFISDHNRHSFSLRQHSHSSQLVILLTEDFHFVSWVKPAVPHA